MMKLKNEMMIESRSLISIRTRFGARSIGVRNREQDRLMNRRASAGMVYAAGSPTESCQWWGRGRRRR